MKLLLVRRLASMFALLALLLSQAWAGPTARLSARACCCKPDATTHSSLAKAKCCGEAKRGRAATQFVVRAAAHDEHQGLAVLPSGTFEVDARSVGISSSTSPGRPPDHGIGTGLSYRLRV